MDDITKTIVFIGGMVSLILALIGIGSSMKRNWRLEEACLRAGGSFTSASNVLLGVHRGRACATRDSLGIVKIIPIK